MTVEQMLLNELNTEKQWLRNFVFLSLFPVYQRRARASQKVRPDPILCGSVYVLELALN